MKTFLFLKNWIAIPAGLLIFCQLQFSCSQNNSDHGPMLLDLSSYAESEVMASEIFDGVSIIRLETSPDILLGGIRELELYDDFIAVLDGSRSFVGFFDHEGNYLKKLFAQGRGGGEYLGIDDFLIDAEQSTLEVLDASARKIHVYDLETLVYKESLPYAVNFAYSFAKAGGYYYFQTNGSISNLDGIYTKSDIIAFDYENINYHPLFEREVESAYEATYSYEFSKLFYKNREGEVFASLSWHDQIYQLDGPSAIPWLRPDLGRRAFPREILQGTHDERMAYINSSLSENKLGFLKLVYKDQDSFMLTCRRSFKYPGFYFFSFNGDDVRFANTIINDFAPFNNQELTLLNEVQGSFLSLAYPFMMEEDLLARLDVSAEDNPVILLFEMKK